MRGHNICFHGEMRKIILNYPQYPLLSGVLIRVFDDNYGISLGLPL